MDCSDGAATPTQYYESSGRGHVSITFKSRFGGVFRPTVLPKLPNLNIVMDRDERYSKAIAPFSSQEHIQKTAFSNDQEASLQTLCYVQCSARGLSYKDTTGLAG